MKDIGLFCLLVLLLITPLQSQWSISPASLPKEGDTAYVKIDRQPQIAGLENFGRSLRWDFSRLKAPFWSTVSIEHQTANVESLDSQQLVLKEGNKIKYYLQRKNSGIRIIAKSQKDHFHPETEIVTSYVEPDVLRFSNIKYGDQNEITSSSILSYNAENIPMYLIKGLNQIPDSMRVYLHQTASYDADAYGTLVLPSLTEQVLRLKIEKTDWTTYEFFIGGSWVNAVSKNFMRNSNDYSDSPKTEYHFVNDNYPIPLAIVKMDQDNGINEVTYQIDIEVERNAPKFEIGKLITAIPNPTFGETRFEFYNYPGGLYRIEIYNIIGKRMWRNEYRLPENGIISEDFSFLRKGTYLYSIIDPNGNKVSTKRLVIITP